MGYKWNNPGDWLHERVQSAGEDVLRGYLTAIIGSLDSDTIQDIFQSEMDADGYFDEDEEEDEEDGQLLEPVRDVTRNGTRAATFEVEVPEDLYPTMDRRREHAIRLVRENASDFVMPATYRARIFKRGYEEVYRVVRYSNAIPSKEVSQTTAV